MKIPFWEDSYKDDNVSTFGIQPNVTIDEFQHLFDKSWSVLDVGCGDGKNSLYLAGLGYNKVEAFDLSENAIAKLNRLAASKDLRVNAWTQDLTQFMFSKPYDLVMSFGTLHLWKKNAGKISYSRPRKTLMLMGYTSFSFLQMCCLRHLI